MFNSDKFTFNHGYQFAYTDLTTLYLAFLERRPKSLEWIGYLVLNLTHVNEDNVNSINIIVLFCTRDLILIIKLKFKTVLYSSYLSTCWNSIRVRNTFVVKYDNKLTIRTVWSQVEPDSTDSRIFCEFRLPVVIRCSLRVCARAIYTSGWNHAVNSVPRGIILKLAGLSGCCGQHQYVCI